MLLFAPYEKNSLKNDPVVSMLGKWEIHYLAFEGPQGCQKPPVIVLGGAFQNFTSYRFFTSDVLEIAPVILVDLPSLGNNAQLAANLGLEDLADLLYYWLVQEGITKVSLMGLSLGSVVASTFAFKHPEMSERLIMVGTLAKPRKSWRMLLEESLKLLDAEQMSEFGEAVVLYLINHARLKDTQIPEVACRLFRRQMRTFSENEKQRYRINAHRLIGVEEVLGYPTCPTIVATGNYDSFTLPYENAYFAANCPNAQFALIENADHLPQLERRDTVVGMFCAFLKEEDVAQVEGLKLLTHEQGLALERRGEPRYALKSPKCYVLGFSAVNGDIQIDSPVEIVDINFFGCLLKYESIVFTVQEYARNLILCLPDSMLRIEVLVFERGEGWMRCLFKHGSFVIADEFNKLLKDRDYCHEVPKLGHRPYGAI
ncbi:MAG: alpha/beta hydrolase [Moraxellaceae bacterium]|nr:alpha/beta hydrolase [Moraxellaceae bacterium]